MPVGIGPCCVVSRKLNGMWLALRSFPRHQRLRDGETATGKPRYKSNPAVVDHAARGEPVLAPFQAPPSPSPRPPFEPAHAATDWQDEPVPASWGWIAKMVGSGRKQGDEEWGVFREHAERALYLRPLVLSPALIAALKAATPAEIAELNLILRVADTLASRTTAEPTAS